MKTKTSVLSEDIAENELVEFYNYFALIPAEPSEILEGLDVAKVALMQGLLKFDDDKVPTYTLKHPVKNDEGAEVLTEIVFKTRILPNDHIKLSKGLNIQKQTMEYALRCQAHLAQLPTAAYLNKLSKFDYTVVQQVGTVFA